MVVGRRIDILEQDAGFYKANKQGVLAHIEDLYVTICH
jgi:hypothetical protein